MKALALITLAASSQAAALPPITQEEAIAFHASGRCVMVVPGTGLASRPDGFGWILSPLPGKHRVWAEGGTVTLPGGGDVVDMDAGRPYKLVVTPSTAQVQWCVPFVPPGRDRCGPVPTAFLYPAVTVKARDVR